MAVTGSIRKRQDRGYWEIILNFGYDENGKRQRKRYRADGTSKGEAQAEMALMLERYNRQSRTGEALDNACTLTLIKDEWLKAKCLDVENGTTLAQYTRDFNTILSWLEKKDCTLVSDVTPAITRDFQLAMSKAGKSNRTVNLYVNKLRRALVWAIDEKLIAYNPIKSVKNLPKKKRKQRRNVCMDEAKALIANSPGTYRDIWHIIMLTGMRRGEMEHLRVRNVDMHDRSIEITDQPEWKPKRPASYRVIPLNAEALKIIKKHIKGKRLSELVFQTQEGTPVKNNLNRTFRTNMKNALRSIRGVPVGKNLSKSEKEKFADDLAEIEEEFEAQRLDIHSLRYTYITELIKAGTDPKTVQALAGHESVTTTLDIYAQCCDEMKTGAVANLSFK